MLHVSFSCRLAEFCRRAVKIPTCRLEHCRVFLKEPWLPLPSSSSDSEKKKPNAPRPAPRAGRHAPSPGNAPGTSAPGRQPSSRPGGAGTGKLCGFTPRVGSQGILGTPRGTKHPAAPEAALAEPAAGGAGASPVPPSTANRHLPVPTPAGRAKSLPKPAHRFPLRPWKSVSEEPH